MKSVTEFAIFTLSQGLKTRTDLTAEGKTPEEIQAKLGETFKYEGDKLKYFTHAIEVCGQNLNKLKRVLVMSLSEGENAPLKAVKLEEMHYVPEFHSEIKHQAEHKSDKKGGKGKGRQGGGQGRGQDNSLKESPWGLSPEQKAAKLGKAAGAKKTT